MLEQLLIFTRGGLILWTCIQGSGIDALIRFYLLGERSKSESFENDVRKYTLKWTSHNDLVFVAVYYKILNLLYVDELLSMVKRQFLILYDPCRMDYSDFDDVYRQLRLEAEARAEQVKKSSKLEATNVDKKHDQMQKTKFDRTGGDLKSGNGDGDGDGNGDGDGDGDFGKENKLENSFVNGGSSFEEVKPEGGVNMGGFDINRLKKLLSKGRKKNDTVVANKKATKKNGVGVDQTPQAKLDYSDPVSESGDKQVNVGPIDEGHSMMDKEEVFGSDDEEEEEEELVESNAKVKTKSKGWLSSVLQSIVGKSNLERTDLEPALKALKDRLMTKNVAEEIAEKLCESVAASLEGKKLASFTRVAMDDALVRILTPERSIDILRDVHAAKEQGKPYVVVFVGVNGVGKSTNLAKVAHWLLQHKVSVMMAACDTFRSGAVEQLRTHASRLEIPIFEKGYEKNPVIVAKEAIQEATRNGSDVVLVDTAGRMQDNVPLMRELSKLIYRNNPDLVLFVGEALVGNDAVDQLSKFNQKLADLSPSPNPRLIDGILLTKFDTIDDKVGAALSMVYISGAPVMFVGCGQSYTDLKKLDVKSIVETLLK